MGKKPTHKNKRLDRILELGTGGMKHALRNPTGALHEFERQTDESWDKRWERMFEVIPPKKESKKTSNADNSDSISATTARYMRRKKIRKRL